MVHDPSKVSAAVLSDNDVVIRHTSQGDVISIDIPQCGEGLYSRTWARIR